MRIAIHAKTKHPDLWPLAKQYGSVKALSEAVGANYCSFHRWVTLSGYPKILNEEVVDKLRFLTAKSIEELWPEELRHAIDEKIAGRELTRIADVSRLELAEGYAQRMLLPAPDDVAAAADEVALVRERLRRCMARIRPRYRKALELRYGLDGESPHTQADGARVFNVTKERFRQLEITAVRKLKAMLEADYPGWMVSDSDDAIRQALENVEDRAGAAP